MILLEMELGGEGGGKDFRERRNSQAWRLLSMQTKVRFLLVSLC